MSRGHLDTTLSGFYHEEWVQLYIDGVPVKEIAKKYNRKPAGIYAALRSKMGYAQYQSVKIRNYEKLEMKRKVTRSAILHAVKERKSPRQIAKEFDISKYGVKYYLDAYLTKEERSKYFADLKSSRSGTNVRIVYLVNQMMEGKSISEIAEETGQKANTLWVFLRRNADKILELTGHNYSDLLSQPKK